MSADDKLFLSLFVIALLATVGIAWWVWGVTHSYGATILVVMAFPWEIWLFSYAMGSERKNKGKLR